MEDMNFPETEQSQSKRGLVILLAIVAIVLLAGVGVLIFKYVGLKNESAETQALLEEEKVSLETQLTDLQGQFGDLQTNNDSLLNLASEQQVKIEKLLKVQADNAYKIKMYQKELKSLREVLKSYIVQVDSLNQRNQQLVAENKGLSKKFTQERARTEQLSKDKEQLSSTVQKAQVLTIGEITVMGLNNRGKETPRVRNIEKLKTCFTVRENQVASAGERVFYVQVIRPNGQVIDNADGDTFTSQEGAELVYTDKRTVEYENMDIEGCIFTDNKDLKSGTYEVKIFESGYLLGSTKFSLK